MDQDSWEPSWEIYVHEERFPLWNGRAESQNSDLISFSLWKLLNELLEKDIQLYYSPITLEESHLTLDLDSSNFDALEQIVFMWFPEWIYNEESNLPITRSWITATPVFVDHDEWESTFLIDWAVFPWNSWWPVFLFEKKSGIKVDWNKMSFNDRCYFLWILSYVITTNSEWEPIKKPITKKQLSYEDVENLLNLWWVIKWNVVYDFFNSILSIQYKAKIWEWEHPIKLYIYSNPDAIKPK